MYTGAQLLSGSVVECLTRGGGVAGRASLASLPCVLEQSKEEGKDQESIQTTQDTVWESDKNTRNITYKRAKRSAFSQQVTTRLQETDKTGWQRQITKKDPQKKHHLGMVSKKITELRVRLAP